MKSWKRWLAALLCAALLAGLSGCSLGLPLLVWSTLKDRKTDTSQAQSAFSASQSGGTCGASASCQTSAAGQTAEAGTLAKDGYFGDVSRGDTAYADMKPDAPTQEEFQKLADAIAAFAESGGDQDAFDDAAWDAEYALYRFDTASCLYDLQNSANSGNEKLGAQTNDAQNQYDTANDAYWTAMHAVAVSGHKALLKKNYSDSVIDMFRTYDGSGASDTRDLSAQESTLERQYEALISESEVDYDAICELYVKLVGVRNQIAQQAGYDTFADYAYEYLYSRGYTPEDAKTIWTEAREQISPLVTKYKDAIQAQTGSLYYSDELDCSPDAILSAIQTGADGMSPEVSAAAQYLRKYGLYDIESTGTKLSTGYTTYFSQYNEPFIFNCPYDAYYDYTDMFHEFGHFLAYFYNGADVIFGVSDYDLSELQSQGMEVMFFRFYDKIFGARNAKIIRAGTLLNLLYSVVDGAMYDEFQQRVYTEKKLTADRVKEIFQEVYESYGYEPYDGFQKEWMDQIHNFEQPMYYISYAVSAIPALELYAKQQTSPSDAMDAYLRVAAMSDENYYLADAVKEAGLPDVFAEGTCRQIAQSLQASGALGMD